MQDKEHCENVTRHLFTVFTPTYNRAKTLHRVYESLSSQTFRDFEWLVIDDGSTDGTGELIDKWKKETSFPIRYIWQENGGKHTAFNLGVQKARGELFLQLDSDDGCAANALERFKYHWENISETERQKYTAVTALCIDEVGRVVGDRFPEDVIDSDSLEITYKFRIKGEKWGFHRTEVLRKYPFPTIPGVKFIPEGIVWSAIARQYRTRFVNEGLRTYYQDAGAQGCEQLTKSQNPGHHATSMALWHRFILNHEINWFWFAPERFLVSAVHYARYSFHLRDNVPRQIGKLNRPLAYTLYIIAVPVGWFTYLRDIRKRAA